MGVQSFTKVFEPQGEFTYKEFKGKSVVIDASVEIYRAALGMKLSETLTDAFGNPTAHINVILLGVILKLKAVGASQYWIFDYHSVDKSETFHNPLKQLELQKRKAKRVAANEKLVILKKSKEQELFSEESESETDELSKNLKNIKVSVQSSIDTQEKVAFVMKRFYTEDIIFILDMLEIPWLQCPSGYDAEQIAAFATNNKDIFGKKIDYVFTPDSDALLFGAKKLIKRDIRKKKLFYYNLSDLLKEYELTQDNFIKVGLMLGTDFAKKSPGIGPKTVLKKYKTTELTQAQIDAMNQNFKKVLTKNELELLVIHNDKYTPFTNEKKYIQFLDWLEIVKNYNRIRIMKQFEKNKLFINNH